MTTADIDAIPILAELSPEERARVASVARKVHFAVGSVVLKEGEFAFDFYAIKHGTAEVQRGGERLRELGQGDVFGELGVVASDAGRLTRRRSASVIITSPTDAIVIDGSDLRRLTQEISALRDALRATAAERVTDKAS
jgi:CRP-like cAMP-binding protein